MLCKISVKAELKGRGEVVLSTNAKNPGILFACTTSREVALSQLSECLDLGTKQIQFDPANDTICIYEMFGNPPRPLLLPGRLSTQGLLVRGIPKSVGIQRLLISLGFSAQFKWILSQFPNLKKLIIAWENFEELQTLDIDSLRVQCAFDITGMEGYIFKKWSEHQDHFDSNWSGMKATLDRINKARGEGNHVEVSWAVLKVD